MKKTKHLLLATCCSFACLGADEHKSYLPGEPIKADQLTATYPQDASYLIENGLDCFATVDYLYWQWTQGLLQIGTLVTPTGSDYVFGNAQAILQAPGYRSGFQTGFGCYLKGMDDWKLYTEYTWYRNTSNENLSTPAGSVLILPNALFREDQQSLAGYHYVGTVDSTVRLGFQSLDFLFQKSLYLGKRLSATLASGLRAQWISEKIEKEITGSIIELPSTPTTVTNSILKQTTWGIGPKFSLDLNYLLGFGLKMISQLSMSFVYTSYNGSNEYNNLDIGHSFSETTLNNSGSIKPLGEAFLGLGWGSYFCQNKFHLDLSLGYDFDIYWNYVLAAAPISQTVANLQLQGLRASMRFDF
jgi:hypothetical protein